MPILDSESTAPGTHPSLASSHTIIECDRCGKVFHADCRVSEQWMFHSKPVGITDSTGREAEELCLDCEAEVFGDV